MLRYFKNTRSGLESPAQWCESITPDDSNDLDTATRGIYVGSGGNIKLTTLANDTVTFVDVPSGSILPVRAKRVFDTDTTASNLIGMT